MGLVNKAGRLAASALVPVKGAVIAGLRAAQEYTPVAWHSPTVTYVGTPWNDVAQVLGYDVRNVSPSVMFKTQPALRTVVDFMARNTAQLGLHVFEKKADGGRERAGDSLVARTLDWVDGDMTAYDLVYATVGDMALYDVAYWWVFQDSNSPTNWTWLRLPPNWVTPHPEHTTPFRVNAYLVNVGAKLVTVPRAEPYNGQAGIIRVGGYDPATYNGSSSAVETLRETLQEQIEATTYRKQVWKRGGRVSAVIERPADAEPWSDAAREAFREDWYAKFTGNGPKAGGTPILEDGMKLSRIDFNAQEQQYVEAAKLTLQTVAGVYQINPTMIGQTEGASYSNVKEFHRMLYSDTLGPQLRKLAQRVNKHVLPLLGMDPRRFYVEFNIQEKLAGSFEEQAAVMSTAVGRPWMTTNEARARQNLPAVDGGDELVTPLNVLVGGQASPRDTGSQNVEPGAEERASAAPGSARQLKAAPTRRERNKATDEVAKVLRKFWDRQAKVLKSKKAGKLAWDTERWDKELAQDLLEVAREQSVQAALKVLEAKGLDPDTYDVGRTMAYLRKATALTASDVNKSTRDALERSLEAAEDDPELDPYTQVFEDFADGRAHTWGASVAGFVVGFGMTEAGRQAGGSKATKTWVVNSANPRSSHASMNGETVGINDTFSNGLDWPGSFGDPDEVAGCECSVDVSW